MVKKVNKKTEKLEGGFRLLKRTKKVNTNEDKEIRLRIEEIRDKIKKFNNRKFCIQVYDEQNEKSEYYLIKIVEGYSKPRLYSLKNLNVLIDMKKKNNYNIVGKIDDTNVNDIKIEKLNDNDINLINFMITHKDYRQIGLKIEQQPQAQSQQVQQSQASASERKKHNSGPARKEGYMLPSKDEYKDPRWGVLGGSKAANSRNRKNTPQKVQKPPQGGKNSQYIMTKQGKRKIHVGKRGGKYYIMNKKKVYVK